MNKNLKPDVWVNIGIRASTMEEVVVLLERAAITIKATAKVGETVKIDHRSSMDDTSNLTIEIQA